MKKGFTLVELSIVLVIIGLLIGGILTAQSLVSSSKAQSTIRQLSQYNTALRLFKDKFRAMPGDFNRAAEIWGATPSGNCYSSDAGTGSQTCSGDGDGIVDYNTTGSNNATERHEMYSLWEHLQNAQTFDDGVDYTGTAYSRNAFPNCVYSGGRCFVPGVNMPTTPYGDTTAFTLHYEPGFGSGPMTGKHIFVLFNSENFHTSSWQGTYLGQAITPVDGLAFDAKLDDGLPYTGIVGNLGSSAVSPNCTNGDYTSSAEYNVSYTDAACVMKFAAEEY